jgi:hypothetical protein
MIKGFNHQIKGGSYITILKLMLAVPNVELSRDSNLGGDPNGFKTEIKENKDCGKCVK